MIVAPVAFIPTTGAEPKSDVFNNGSQWLRSDFHLHTRADRTFAKDPAWQEVGKEGLFTEQYVARLKAQQIQVGAITNHNYFDTGEYKALAKAAKRAGIFLLPGVELSINDGNNGIHALILFDPKTWLTAEDNSIDRFLSVAFENVPNQHLENTRCKLSLQQTLEKLDENRKHGRDSLIVMAHVEDTSGFWAELGGGRIEALRENPSFWENVLGFQKVRTDSKTTIIKRQLGGRLPCFVEGSDCKEMAQVGQAHQQNGQEMHCYLKIGEFSFTAVKFALLHYPQRVKSVKPVHTRPYLESITFTGGHLSGQTLPLNAGLNCLIGVRGSGKSTLFEVIRYALGLALDTRAGEDYKDRIVKNLLGSGGKTTVRVCDPTKQKKYRVERIFGERADVYEDTTDAHIPNFNLIAEILPTLYFGQKDLVEIGEKGFNQSLIERFFGERLKPLRLRITEQVQHVRSIIRERRELEITLEVRESLEEDMAAVQHKLTVFREQRVDEKLARQVAFRQDLAHTKQFATSIAELAQRLDAVLADYAGFTTKYETYTNAENAEPLTQLQAIATQVRERLTQVSTASTAFRTDAQQAATLAEIISQRYETLKDDFAEIQRQINAPSLNANDYLTLTNRAAVLNAKLQSLDTTAVRQAALTERLDRETTVLRNLWQQEFSTIDTAVQVLNNRGLAITIKLGFKANTGEFLTYLTPLMKGTGLTTTHLRKIAEAYKDPIKIYADLPETKTSSDLHRILNGGSLLSKFREQFLARLDDLLVYRVPDSCVLEYDKTELSQLSLGQRASGIILFLLALDGFALFMVDQPEDDLDNQSIYRQVVSELVRLKLDTQFIFATHNPNIPVLGDCEQVISCHYFKDQLQTPVTGSIDSLVIRDEIIKVMEGGADAFRRRNEIYQLWKP